MSDKAHRDQHGSREDHPHEAVEDEEAQLLLPAEHFEFEETPETRHPTPRGRVNFLPRIAGPDPPQIQSIRPFLPSVQRYPIHLVDRYFANLTRKIVLVVAFLLLWIIAFSIPLYAGNRAIKDIHNDHVVNLDCVDSLWRRKNLCGLDGLDCRLLHLWLCHPCWHRF